MLGGGPAIGPHARLLPFELHRPVTLSGACRALAELGPDAHVHAGGTELVLVLRAGLTSARHLVDVKRVPGLRSIWSGGRELHVGGAVTHAAIARGAWSDALVDAESRLGNARVRSTGTLGGSLCFAEPHADSPTALLLHDARVRLASVRGERELALDDFLVGALETAREADEILTDVRLTPLPGHGSAHERFAPAERPSATVAAAVALADGRLHDVRIAVGAIGPRAVRVRAAERHADGLPASDEACDELAGLVAAAAQPSSDGDAPAEHTRAVVATLARRALRGAIARAPAA